MSNIKEDTTASIRIDKKVLASIKKYIKGTGQTINSFISIEMRKTMKLKNSGVGITDEDVKNIISKTKDKNLSSII